MFEIPEKCPCCFAKLESQSQITPHGELSYNCTKNSCWFSILDPNFNWDEYFGPDNKTYWLIRIRIGKYVIRVGKNHTQINNKFDGYLLRLPYPLQIDFLDLPKIEVKIDTLMVFA